MHIRKPEGFCCLDSAGQNQALLDSFRKNSPVHSGVAIRVMGESHLRDQQAVDLVSKI